MFNLHFSTTKVSATVHVAGCRHAHLKGQRVTALVADTLAGALAEANEELRDNGMTAKASPCTKGA